ncbi:MAG TPA: hypothetical protein VIL48_21045 [Acidimicrobiales bacterium]
MEATGADTETAVDAVPSATPSSPGDEPGPGAPAEADGDEAGAKAAGAGAGRHRVHRLRDLGRRGRLWAAVFAAVLLLAPALAFAWAAPDWAPANDPALMALRALDVGTSHTPLTGQPSTSAHYVGADQHVDHPGPLHFYLMAGPVRLLGTAIGMLVVSVAITGGCVLLAAWAIFRQLGCTAGVLAAVILGAITFTTGAASLVNPVSSNIAGYPLLCSMVLLWCLVCGDVRLLPLAAAVVTFTAQQHLSVLPALGAATVLALAVGAVAWGRARWHDREARRDLGRWVALAAAVALVLWAPVLVEQFSPDGGNLSRMAEFARSSDRPTVGLGSAVYQVTNVLGLPPLLGQTQLQGGWLLDRPSALTWASAAVVVALLALLGARWRRAEPRRLLLVVMAAILALGGLVNGSAVPESLEKFRLPLYHWAWPLTLCVVLALGLGLADAARRLPALGPALARPGVRPALAGVAVLAIVVPAAVNPSLDRISNTMTAAYSPVPRPLVERAADQVMDHRAELDGEVVVLNRGIDFDGTAEGLGVMLTERGLDIRFTSLFRHYVNDERLVDPDAVDAGLMVVVDDGSNAVAPVGELIADVPVVEGFDSAAFDALLRQVEGSDRVRFGPEAAGALPDLPPGVVADIEAGVSPAEMEELMVSASPEEVDDLEMALLLGSLRLAPAARLVDTDVLDFLIEHPLAEPRLDRDLLRRVRAGLPDDWPGGPLRMSVYRLTPDEVARTAAPAELA